MTLEFVTYLLIALVLFMGTGAWVTRKYLWSEYILHPVPEFLLFLTNPYGWVLLVRYLLRSR